MALEYYMADNFKITSKRALPDDIDISHPAIMYDDRNEIVSFSCNFDDSEWYYNYLESLVKLASRNPDAKVCYLLDLGFIPVVALPTCCATLEVTFIHALEKAGLPYVKMPQYSFTGAWKPGLAGTDAWVSKLDIETIMKIPLRDIRVVDVARRIYG